MVVSGVIGGSASNPPAGRRLRTAIALCAVLALLASGRRSDAQNGESLKAAIVVSLLQFVQWPGEADKGDKPLTLCADRAGSIWSQLAPLQGRAARAARPLEVRALPASVEGLRQCDAWVVEPPAGSKLPPPAAAAGMPILVIGDREQTESGGLTVALHWKGDRLAFDIDLPAARRNGLQISSKLLRLAAHVQE